VAVHGNRVFHGNPLLAPLFSFVPFIYKDFAPLGLYRRLLVNTKNPDRGETFVAPSSRSGIKDPNNNCGASTSAPLGIYPIMPRKVEPFSNETDFCSLLIAH
jgi:hypothetical protein